MIRDTSEKSDVVITWPADASRIRSIMQRGRCPSYARPLRARRGATVVLVDPKGHVQLVFTLQKVEWPVAVTGANGKRYENGCELVARTGSMRRPRGADRPRQTPHRYVGGIKYFDAKTGESVWYGGMPQEEPKANHAEAAAPRPLRLVPIHANNAGKRLAKPEAELIGRFTNWLGGPPDRFLTGNLALAEVHVDLFLRGKNLLVEAKANVSRETLRYAVGQLYDYRCYFARPPRMAVLLPERPSTGVLRFLVSRRIACIWETPTGVFRDTVRGAVTVDLRRG